MAGVPWGNAAALPASPTARAPPRRGSLTGRPDRRPRPPVLSPLHCSLLGLFPLGLPPPWRWRPPGPGRWQSRRPAAPWTLVCCRPFLPVPVCLGVCCPVPRARPQPSCPACSCLLFLTARHCRARLPGGHLGPGGRVDSGAAAEAPSAVSLCLKNTLGRRRLSGPSGGHSPFSARRGAVFRGLKTSSVPPCCCGRRAGPRAHSRVPAGLRQLRGCQLLRERQLRSTEEAASRTQHGAARVTPTAPIPPCRIQISKSPQRRPSFRADILCYFPHLKMDYFFAPRN